MIETMKVRVMTPMATPRIVNAERNLFARIVSTAIAADSLMSSNVINFYSARNASIGSSRAAFQAGQMPLTMPTTDETETPSTADQMLMRSGKLINAEMP